MKREMRLSLAIVALLGLLTLFGSAEASDANLVGHWMLDEGTGTIAYDSVGGNDGTINGASWATGRVDGALEFAGGPYGAYIDAGDMPALDITGEEITVMAWFKPASSDGAVNINAQIVSKWLGTNSAYTLGYDYLGETNTIMFVVYTGTNGVAYGSIAVDDTSKWYHLAGVYNGSEVIVYIDGVAGTPVSHTGNIYNSSMPLRISGYGNGHRTVNGTIDEVRIYDRALSAEEVQQLYWGGFSDIELAIMQVEDALAGKESALAVIDAALEKELAAYGALEEALESKDYGELKKSDIIKARQGIGSAIQHQEQSADALEKGIGKLEDALLSLGVEPEPEIVYEVSECGMGSSAALKSDETRFSVVVEGRYIHFEDIVTANCCTDEVELQMEVEDSLIRIYEIEHTTTWCLCICDYPANATLGPFEPGTYTVEVYGDFGDFIGSTTVTIGPEKVKKDVPGLLKVVRTPKPTT